MPACRSSRALVTNELIKTVTLEILQTNADGTQTVAYRISVESPRIMATDTGH